ncbi:ATP-binding cassette domain-containing protein [Piscibacillus sp. B03]|uniref:ATP-binding cassette domain-containing protein n=1 Tax=Piscibacillus sp. B03 TaxID=3457430 RepID=UPI003FCEC7B8
MIEIKDLSIAYGDNIVLDQVSLTAELGEIIGLAAPNGTGKTTLFNVMANYTKPDSGQVKFNGKYTYKTEKDQIKIHKQLATFPNQSDLFEELSGLDHMKLYKNMWQGKKDIQTIINGLNMDHYVRNKVKTYSLGMRQRLCFAMMVAADSPIMLMDEVMNGLDVSNVALISNKLIEMKHEDKLIFIASHLLENLDLYADRVLFLKGGKFIHEHKPNRHENAYLKINVNEDDYKVIKEKYNLGNDHEYISQLLCIPFSHLSFNDQINMIETLLEYDEELAIGPLGTLEYYEKYYQELNQLKATSRS